VRLKNILRGFVIYFVLVMVVSAAVGYLYGAIAHGRGTLDWETSFRFALVLGIALPIVHELERKRD
jgi:hypothetical protein